MSFFTHAEFKDDEYILKRNYISTKIDYISPADTETARRKKKKFMAKLAYERKKARIKKCERLKEQRKINNISRKVRKSGGNALQEIVAKMPIGEVNRLLALINNERGYYGLD